MGRRSYHTYQQKRGEKRDNHEHGTLAFFVQSRNRGFDTWYIYAFWNASLTAPVVIDVIVNQVLNLLSCHIAETEDGFDNALMDFRNA